MTSRPVALPTSARSYSIVASDSSGWVSTYRATGSQLFEVTSTGVIKGPFGTSGIAAFAAEDDAAWLLDDRGGLYRFDLVKKQVDESLQTHLETNKGFSPWSASLDTSTNQIWITDYENFATEVTLKN